MGCDRRRERLLAADAVTAEPGRAPLVRVRSGACSRAEAKGGGAPTGMSATAAVVGKPIYTPPSLRRKRPNAVPVPFRADIPRIDAGDNCAVMAAMHTLHRTNMRAKGVPMPCQPTFSLTEKASGGIHQSRGVRQGLDGQTSTVLSVTADGASAHRQDTRASS